MGDLRKKNIITVFPVTERGCLLAERLAGLYPGMAIYRPDELKDGRMARKVKAAFKGSGSLIFICASGIAVRMIAPYLKGKDVDPAVILMDESGRFVVSLLSGHLGGANRLTGEIAGIIGATPVITTATDLMGLPCVEEICARFALAIEEIKKIKKVNSAILNNGKVLIIDRDPKRLASIKKAYENHTVFKFRRDFPLKPDGFSAFLFISSGITAVPDAIRDRTLTLRPREFVLGVGCRRGVTVSEIERAAKGILKEAAVHHLSLRNIATIGIKRDEAGLNGYATKMGLGIVFFNADELNKVKLPSRISRVVMENTGAGGVCEPAALLSSGAEKIWIKKIKAGRVTVALSKARFTS